MSTLKVNEIDSKTGTTISVAATKTLDVPAGASLTVEGTANLTSSTLTLPATLPATAGTNITSIPGANITGTIPVSALSNAPATDLDPIEDDIAVLGFQVAAASDLAKYNLRDQIVDTFQTAAGVDASASTAEVYNSAGKYYDGVFGTDATGGTVTQAGGYTYHSFLTSANFVTPSSANIEVLMVAGGAAGGSHHGGGGGGGGIVYDTALAVTAQTYALVVGTGGNAGGANSVGGSGVDSTGFGWTAKGGGGGGHYSNVVGAAGGNGGGGGGYTSAGGATTQTSAGTDSSGTRTAYGFAGQTRSGANGTNGHGGGSLNSTGGAAAFPNFSSFGSSGSFSGGGGNGNDASGSAGGGAGAGAGGASGASGTAATNGTGSGGGGGGGGGSQPGADGGDGWIGVRYTTNGFLNPANNVTLVSTATTAEAGTTATGDLVILYTPQVGTTVLNTNLKAYISRDDGTTYTQATLTGKGSYSGTTEIATAHSLDISAQPAGVTMRWKIETLVQSGALTTRLNGVSLGWS